MEPLPPTTAEALRPAGWWEWMVFTAAGVVALVGGVVLAGWEFQISTLKSLLPGTVSMKPNTALAFVLAGAALTLLARPGAPLRTRAGQGLAVLVALIGGLTLGEYVFGWRLGLDEWLFRDDANAVATLVPGRMALSTAASFALLGLALAGIGWEPRRGFRPAEVLALSVEFVGWSSLAEYALGQPILYGFGEYTRMALHTAAAMLVLATGVLLARPSQGIVGLLRAGRGRPWERAGYVGMGLTALLVLGGGAWFYHAQEQQVQRGVEDNLTAIAQLKADQIVQWRAARLGDAGVLMGSHFFEEGLARWLANPQSGDGEKILARFRAMREHLHYADILLADACGQVRMSLMGESSHAIHEETAQALETAFRMRRPVLTDLHCPPGEQVPHLEIIAPLFSGNEATSELLGTVILQFEARQFLYPLIQTWPTASPSAETLLVRRDGDAVLFLNELRHRKDTALKLRLPLTRQDVPAVMAALGHEGVFHGTDYQGGQVLAVLKHIPDSPWSMVAKVDKAEALAEWRFRGGLIVSVVAMLVLALAAAARMIWDQRRRYQTLAQAESSIQALNAGLEQRVLERTDELIRSEENLSVTLQSIGDAVLTTDTAGHVTRLNPIAEKLTGWTQAEAQGRPIAEIFHIINEATRQPSEIPVDKVLATGEIHGLANHTILIARDGTERPIADSAAPIRDREGKTLGVVIVFRDVSSEHGLETLQRQFAAIVESSDDAIISKSLDGIINGWNAGAERMFGYSAREALGQSMLMLFPPDHVDEEAQILARLQRGEQIDHFEAPRTRKDGTQIDVSVTLSPIRNAAGEVTGISKIARDITASKRMEEAIRASEILNRAVLNSVLANIAIVDIHGGIIAVNEGWEKFARENGCDPRSIKVGVGANYVEVCEQAVRDLGAEAQEVLDGLRGVLSGSQDQFKHEYDCHSPTEQRWFTMHVSPLNRPDGGAVIAQINITDLKRAEAQIVQINATLEQRVLERTAELQLERSKLSATFENMAMGVVICNPQGGEIVMNAAALRMHGFASREDQNTRIADYADDWELRDAAGRVLPFAGWPLPRAIAGDFCRDWEVHLRHIKSQHERDCSYTSVPVRNDAGEIRLLVMTLLDITERKRVMEEIRKLNTELEERVCQRTAALSAANQELAAFNRVMVDREQRIIGMKEEVNALCLELGRAVEYPPVWEEESK